MVNIRMQINSWNRGLDVDFKYVLNNFALNLSYTKFFAFKYGWFLKNGFKFETVLKITLEILAW